MTVSMQLQIELPEEKQLIAIPPCAVQYDQNAINH